MGFGTIGKRLSWTERQFEVKQFESRIIGSEAFGSSGWTVGRRTFADFWKWGSLKVSKRRATERNLVARSLKI